MRLKMSFIEYFTKFYAFMMDTHLHLKWRINRQRVNICLIQITLNTALCMVCNFCPHKMTSSMTKIGREMHHPFHGLLAGRSYICYFTSMISWMVNQSKEMNKFMKHLHATKVQA